MYHNGVLVYTLQEVADKLKISLGTARNLVRRGVLPRVDIGIDRVLIPASAVEKLVEQYAAGGETAEKEVS